MKPFFSIITPVKNGEMFVTNYINCLLKQTFDDWEAIIVDDNSNDKTYEKLLINIGGDKRFRIRKLSKTKKIVNGPYLARNEALSYSQGKYILFFDIDDYWLPEKLRRYKKIIDKNKTDFIFSRYLRLNTQKKRFQFRSPNYWLFKNFINIYNPIPNCTACIKKELIKDIIFKPINHEDWMFWIDLFENNKNLKVFVDHNINSLYRIHEHSISYSKFKSIKWIILIYKRQGFNNIKILVFLIIRFLFIIFNLISDLFFYFYFVRLNRSIFRNIISDLEL